MTTCIGMMFQDEAHWLRLHLPILAESGLPIVALDGGSKDDGASVIREYEGVVYRRKFEHDFGAQANALFDCCDGEHYSSVIWLAPDELMYPEDLLTIAELLKTENAMAFPRFNFMKNRLHVSPEAYPDYQIRAWKLRNNIRVSGSVHETVYKSIMGKGWMINQQQMHIYHYGGINPMTHLALKHINYQRIEQGLPVFDELPEGMNAGEYPKHVLFSGKQPLEPIDIHAPFEVG